MSDPMRPRHSTPAMGQRCRQMSVTCTRTPPRRPRPGRRRRPGVEADAQDSSVLELQLIEQGGWHELDRALAQPLPEGARAPSASRTSVRSRPSSRRGSAIRRVLSRPWTRLTAKTPRTRRSSAISCGFQPHLDAWGTWRPPPGASSRRCLDTKRRSWSSRSWPAQGERWDELAQLLSQHVALTADTPDAAVTLLHELATVSEVRLGDARQAARAWENILLVSQQAPTSQQAMESLERLYESMDDVEGYLGDPRAQGGVSLESDAEFVAIHHMMAALWEGRMERPLRACQALEKILAVHPADAHVHRELERLYRQEQQWHELARPLRAPDRWRHRRGRARRAHVPNGRDLGPPRGHR